MGLPTAPSRNFAPPDSVTTELLSRPGYQSTRYRADTATVFVQDERVYLKGKALTERRGTSLEADTITYRRSSCLLDATGEPKLFDRGQVLIGQGIRYDTCVRRGVISDALTNFSEGSTVWFLRGDVSQDSSSSRIYAASSEITSCDLPVPHYHFAGRQVKWVSTQRASGAAGGIVRAGRAHPLAAVHLPGYAAGAALGNSDPPIRLQ